MNTSIEILVRQYLEGIQNSAEVDILHERSDNRGGLLRLYPGTQDTIIIKIWRVQRFYARAKVLARASNGWREWRLQRYFYDNGIAVPTPLSFQSLSIPNKGYYEIVAIEDLGETERGVPYLKGLIKNKREHAIADFERFIIETTAKLINLNVYDIDNQLNNYLINSDTGFWRIDFECARKRLFKNKYRLEYAKMLERLLRSHLHAAYPESDRTSSFMSRVAKTLSIPNDIKRIVGDMTKIELAKENVQAGNSYAIMLDW